MYDDFYKLDKQNPSGLWNFTNTRTSRHFGIARDDKPQDLSLHSVKLSGSYDKKYWRHIVNMPNLVEIQLISPTHQQIDVISNLTQLKRLSIQHYRPKTLDFLSPLVNLEELSLDAVSGFSDLSPIGALKNLKSLRLELLRRVKDFSGLRGAENLRYHLITGNFDFYQPIESFNFLYDLKTLEYLILGEVKVLGSFPTTLPIVNCKSLKFIRANPNTFSIKEFALLNVGLQETINGLDFSPIQRMAYCRYDKCTYGYESASMPKDLSSTEYTPPVIKPSFERPAILDALFPTNANPRSYASNENEKDGPIFWHHMNENDDPKVEILEDNFIPLGKGARRFNANSKNANARAAAYIAKYEALKNEMRLFLNQPRKN